MLRKVCAVSVAWAALASPAAALAPPAAEDEGSAGTSCRWNPFATIECNGPTCWWVGRFEWYTPDGAATGIPCV